ncbi:Sialin like protein [Argiope bruennichi]|uniref:Sialin like protein n=1 Tax=Argiope bruennichi TaxID=94029 RepID=A0A8T0F911_ARGBR|nr:Sialin like protein [Argiope bruennichi]
MNEGPNLPNESSVAKSCNQKNTPFPKDLRESDASAITKKHKNMWQSLLQCRYIVTLLEFFVFFEIDAYRLATSMSVVAMVNNTAANSRKNFNLTFGSCPINESIAAESSLPNNDGEFNWSPEIQGYVLGAGFMGYVISQIPGGLLAEAYGAKITIVGGLFLSSMAHILCPFAAWHSSYLMIAMQLLRGVGQNGILTSIPFIFQALFIFIGGWISKWMITQNYIGIDKARKWCTLLYALGYSGGVLGIYFAGCDRVWSNIFSITAMSFIGLSVPGCMVAPIDMSPTFAGSLFGLSNTIASSASFLLPIITGLMLNEEESLEQWNKIFLLCIAVIMSSGILFCVFGSADVQPWNFPCNEDNGKNLPKDEDLGSGYKKNTLTREVTVHI